MKFIFMNTQRLCKVKTNLSAKLRPLKKFPKSASLATSVLHTRTLVGLVDFEVVLREVFSQAQQRSAIFEECQCLHEVHTAGSTR